MADDKRELNNSEQTDAAAFDSSASEADNSPGSDGANGREGSGAFAPSGFETIYGEEIVPEHLDELPDVENVEEYVDGKHVYDEETAGALVALMFAKTHQEPEQYTPPKMTEQSSQGSAQTPPPEREQVTEPAPKKKKKGKLGCVVSILLIGIIVVGCAWLFPEINWDYVFGGFLDSDVANDETAGAFAFNYHTEWNADDGEYVVIDGANSPKANIVIPGQIGGHRVRYIANEAFRNDAVIRSVVIPGSVESIGQSAFEGCTNLETVSLAGGLLSINYAAFKECYSLKQISLPQTLTEIGEEAFWGCRSLGEITIPSGVWSVRERAFAGCERILIYCMSESQPAGWSSGWCDGNAEIIWSLDVTDQLVWSVTSEGASIDGYNGYEREVYLPETIEGFAVVRIGESAFEGKPLEKIVIPDTVKEIAYRAFNGCWSLAEVNMPRDLEVIGDQAFYNVAITELYLPYGLVSIGTGAFSGASWLDEVYIPETVETIGPDAFYASGAGHKIYCESESEPEGWSAGWCRAYSLTFDYIMPLTADDMSYSVDGGEITFGAYTGSRTKVEIPSEIDGIPVTKLGQHAFLANTKIKKAILPDSIELIGYAAFEGCTSLKSVNIPASVERIEGRAFYLCSALESVEVESKMLTVIEESVFASCESLRNIDLPDSLIELASGAFNGCSSLERIRIPGGVGIVAPDAFLSCSSLRYVELAEGIERVSVMAFQGCYELATVAAPSTLTKIDDAAFRECFSLLEIRLPSGTVVVGDAFDNTPTVISYLDSYNLNGISYTVVSPYGEESYVKILGADYNVTEINIPAYYDGHPVRVIGSYAFSGRDDITSVRLPETLKTIESGAFEGCALLAEITAPAGTMEIGYAAFYGCTSLTRARILGAEIIGDSAFGDCSALSDITLPDGLLEIGYGAFTYCSALREIFIPESVEDLAYDAFDYCDDVKLYTSRGESSYDWASYGGFDDNVTVYWNYKVPAIYEMQVTYTEDGAVINSVATPGVLNIPLQVAGVRVVAVGSNMLDNNKDVTVVRIPTTVTTIESTAFYDCSNLDYVYIPASVTKVETNAFIQGSGYLILCEAMSEPAGWEEYWNNTGCEVLWAYAADRPEDMYNYLVDSSNKFVTITGYTGILSKITIPEYIGGYRVKKIGSYAFSGNSVITEVVIPEGIEVIEESAFESSSIERITLSSTVYEIGDRAFWQCTSLNDVYFVEGLEIIGADAFRETRLADVYLPDGVKEIGERAFAECDYLTGISIPDSVTYIGSSAFVGSDAITIYCEASEPGENWAYDWNADGRAVYWRWR